MTTCIRSFRYVIRRCQSRIVTQSYRPVPATIRTKHTTSLSTWLDEEMKKQQGLNEELKKDIPLNELLNKDITLDQEMEKDIALDKETITKILAELASEGAPDDISADEVASLLSIEGELEALKSSSNMITPSDTLDEPEDNRSSLREIFDVYDTPDAQIHNALQKHPPFRELKPQKIKPGLLNMGVEPGDDPEDDPEFEGDDMSSLAHEQLEQHREFREYARLAAWEMPLLTKMAKPFVPPTKYEVLRFRYTTYMGEEHPAEKKVVVEFCPADMPNLTPIQMEKLKKLAGVRYNPETDIIKMSSEMFETQAQNKRFLGDLVDVMLREARDPTDTFEDIPLDTRHHVFRVKPKFPAEWRMTEERRAQLEAERRRAQLADQEKIATGHLIDGVKRIQDTHLASARALKPEAELATAGKSVLRGKRSRRLI